MFLPKSIKIFVGFTVIFASSCSFWQNSENQNANVLSATLTVDESKSAIPFSSKEPDVYQAEVVLTNYSDGEKSERKIFTARNGAKLRCDYENKISFLQVGEDEKFLIHNGKKIYAENQTNFSIASESGDTIKDFLTTEWLNEKRGAKFERLGAENGFVKYRVRLEDAPNTASETFIYVDENLKIPVKQEFYTTNGEQRILVFSMELQNLKLQTDDKLFELPKEFRKVSMKEFQKIVWQEKFNTKNE
jgi:outer membrane lipoprotein-sorting protein